MLNIILYQPEIPPNTGNIIRLCANTGAKLHLIKPLGFPLDSNKMRRAGLDYHELTSILVHETLEDCLKVIDINRLFALTTKGTINYSQPRFQDHDSFIFGPETRGLPLTIINSLPEEQRLRLPMQKNSRSMNLSNTVAVMLFEAWKQIGFDGCT